MLSNYLKIAWRNFARNKTFSFINMSGLAIGLSSFLLIALYVMDELSYDRYYDKAGNIYRIDLDSRWGGQESRMAQIGDPIGPKLKDDYPQVEEFTRIFYSRNNPGLANMLVRKGDEYLTENNTAYVDSTFFNVFPLPAVQGDIRTALKEPGAVVLTASTAIKYFGSVNAVGQTILVKENGRDVSYKVNAVIRDIPGNTHFSFNIMFSMRSLDYHWGQVGNSNFYTYLKLKEGADVGGFQKGLTGYILNYFGPVLKDLNMSSVKELQTGGNSIYFQLTPVTRIHLHSNRQAGEEMTPSGSIQYVSIFSAVAVLILLIACINFMNLTTARSAGRAREVGIRKVLGTERKELVIQFLTESTLMVFLSLLIAVGIAFFALPLFNSVASKSMHFESLFSPYILPLLLVLPVAVGLLAGSYPAFFLSSFRPIQVLKGKLNMGTKSGGLRSALVVFQFTASIVLIIGTIVVYRQLHFIQTRDLGFSKDQVLIINSVDALGSNAESFKNQVAGLSGIKSATLSGYLPVSSSSRNAYNVFKDPVAASTNSFNAQFWGIDYGYLETMGIKLSKGRNFSPAFGQDSSSSWIINESTASILGYPDPIGKRIYTIDNGKAVAHPIVGVVKNFNYESLHSSVGPLIFALQKSTELASFKLSPTRLTPLIESVKNTWKTMAPGVPFSYRFLDESFNEMYQAEQRVGKIAMIFSVLAIIISCLGIFGLATFIAEQRMKEIGIRKVLGASVQGIVGLLSKEFLFLVGIAFLVAAPLAWWFMNQWLQGFVERAPLSWWIFATSGFAVTCIALATVSFQSIRAAVMNPTKSLKAE